MPSRSSLLRAAEFPVPAFALVLLVVVLAPLPLGSNRPFFEALLGIAAGLALLSWSFWHLKSGKGQLTSWKPILAPGACIAAVLVWSLVQSLPVPPQFAHPVWQQGGAFHTLSVNPFATRIGLMRLVTSLVFFLLAYQAGRSSVLAQRLVLMLALSAAAYAFYGLLTYAFGNSTLLWLDKWAYEESLTGTFVNRNAFAAYCGMGLLACSAIFALQVKRELDHAPSKNILNHIIDHLPPLAWAVFTGMLVLALALAFSDSRAGLASTALGLAVLWAGLFLNRALPRKLLTGLGAIALAVGLLAVAIAGQGLLSRFSREVFARDERPQIWDISLKMIADAPLTGQGLNTYGDLFLQYRDERVAMSYIRAHSTYLELAVELGLPAATLWFLAFALVGWQLLKGVRTRRQHALYPILALAVLAQASTHSLIDFSFQMPANAALLAMLLGLGMAQSYRSGEETA